MHGPDQGASEAQAATVRRYWDRIGIGIRCAYNPNCACALRAYLAAGRRVVACAALSERQVQMRTLRLLLQVAQDEALPWFWRSVCLDHASYPLARLKSLMAAGDPLSVQALDGAVRAAAESLGAPPGTGCFGGRPAP